MCGEYDSRDLPVCPCGGDLFINSDDPDEPTRFFGVCESCGRIGKYFDFPEDALEDLYTWK